MSSAERVLKGLLLLPLDRVTDHAESWREDIEDALEELGARRGLPRNDPLRYRADGSRLTREELDTKLQMIIDSWPSWEKEKAKHGRRKAYKKDRTGTHRARRG